MSWRVELDQNRRVIHAIYEGPVALSDVRECAKAVIELMKQADTGLVLTDLRGVSRFEGSPVDVVNMPELFRALGVDRRYREALVVSHDGKVFDQASFYETVSVNRGLDVRLFADRERALAWLTASA